MINAPALEAICRRIYGLARAFEDVHKEADWQKPRNFQGKWKSKVKWQLLEEYGVRALEHNELAVPEADEEVVQRLKTKALVATHLGQLGEALGDRGEGNK